MGPCDALVNVASQQPQILRRGRDPYLISDTLSGMVMAIIQRTHQLLADRHQRNASDAECSLKWF